MLKNKKTKSQLQKTPVSIIETFCLVCKKGFRTSTFLDSSLTVLPFILFSFYLSVHSVLANSTHRVVGSVDQRAISHQDVMNRLALMCLSSGQALNNQFITIFYPQVLATLVDEGIQRKVAQKAGISVAPEEIQERLERIEKEIGPGGLGALLGSHGISKRVLEQQIEAALLWMKYIDRKYSSYLKISQKDVQRFQENWRKEHKGTLYRLGEIVLYVNPAAPLTTLKQSLELRRLLESGVLFVKLARQFSQSPSREAGGDLGWKGLYRLDPELHPYIKNTEIGNILGPIPIPSKKPYKYVIVALLDRKEPSQLNLTCPSDEEVFSILRSDMLSAFAKKEMDNLRRKGQYEIRNPSGVGGPKVLP